MLPIFTNSSSKKRLKSAFRLEPSAGNRGEVGEEKSSEIYSPTICLFISARNSV